MTPRIHKGPKCSARTTNRCNGSARAAQNGGRASEEILRPVVRSRSSGGGQSVAHCVSISVRVSAALLDASAGRDLAAPYWGPPPAGRFVDEVERAPGRLRIALCVTPWNDEPVDAECRQAAEDAARLCEGLGHHVAIGRPEFDTGAFRAATRTLVAANVLATLEARAMAVGKTLEASDVGPL